MYCPNCGFKNRANVKFCEKCGAQLSVADSPPTPAGGAAGWANETIYVQAGERQWGFRRTYLLVALILLLLMLVCCCLAVSDVVPVPNVITRVLNQNTGIVLICLLGVGLVVAVFLVILILGIRWKRRVVQPQGGRPPTVVVRQPGGGCLSGVAGLVNFILVLILLGLILFVVLSMFCVINLPSRFPLFELPAPLDTLWSRAVSLQRQWCGTSPVPAPSVPTKRPSVPQPSVTEESQSPTDDYQPACSSGFDFDACIAAGGQWTEGFAGYWCLCPGVTFGD